MTPASLLLVLTLAAPPSFEQLREQGTRAYRAKREEMEQRRKAPAQQQQEERR
ncbi:MAG TPA: hypothetical protein VE153_21420 [Myxococcus sp.]|jgi:hypothetical protein|nr:hypothetical protein [Myxococcus sp.]